MFSDRLRACRIFRGLTLQATASKIGVSLRTYQRYEGGKAYPDYMHLVAIADFMQVPTDYLLGRDEYLSALGVTVDVPETAPPRRPRPHSAHRLSQPPAADNIGD